MAYYYCKQCRACGTVYNSKEISKEVFDNTIDNPALDYSYENSNDILTIISCCNACAEELYATNI